MRTFLQKLNYALSGIGFLVRNERHFQYHLISAFSVIILGVFFSLTGWEWLFVSSALFLVLLTEAFNTAIEKICNEITLEHKESIKRIKDISAGAVLIAAIFSIVVGLLIFIPKVMTLL
jgi:diacylglycerol kinase